MTFPTDRSRKALVRGFLTALILLAGNLLFFLTIWMAKKYDQVTLDQFIYQMKSSAAGANRSLRNSALVKVGGYGIAATLGELVLYWLCSGNVLQFLRGLRPVRWLRGTRFSRFVAKRAIALVLAVLVFSCSLFTVKLNLV